MEGVVGGGRWLFSIAQFIFSFFSNPSAHGFGLRAMEGDAAPFKRLIGGANHKSLDFLWT